MHATAHLIGARTRYLNPATPYPQLFRSLPKLALQASATERLYMFAPKKYRAKADEYAESIKMSVDPDRRREFQALQRKFSALAGNEQWLADDHQKTLDAPEQDRSAGATLAEEEEHVLRCLGAALIMHWDNLPAKLRRELFDTAGTMGELLGTVTLRGQIARFLDKHASDKESAAI